MSKKILYENLLTQTEALLSSETDHIANLANVSAVMFYTLPQINWAGFYLLKNGVLVLGPFQGKPACVRIAPGRGVCGRAVQTGQTQRVKNVHEFAGHIACDSASKSELVVPIFKEKTVWGVLDIDSPVEGRFDEQDQQYLEKLVERLQTHLFGQG